MSEMFVQSSTCLLELDRTSGKDTKGSARCWGRGRLEGGKVRLSPQRFVIASPGNQWFRFSLLASYSPGAIAVD